MISSVQTTPDVYQVDRPLHHQLALSAYEASFYHRNLTKRYREQQFRRLNDVFQQVQINDEKIPSIQRPVDTFDIGNPLLASKIVESCYRDISPKTRATACLKAIERYCIFLQENLTIHVTGQKSLYLPSIYGPIQSPVNRYTIPKKSHEQKSNSNYLTATEYKRFLRYTWSRINSNLKGYELLKACQIHLMCVIGGEMGLRLNEILGLEIQYLNLLDNVCLVVRGKGNCGSGYRKREVPISPLAKATLQNFLRQFPRERKAPLFQSVKGERLSTHTAGQWMRQLLREIQESDFDISIFSGFGWHALRRTFATLYLEQGGDIKSLMLITGWSFVSTASHYLGYSKDKTPSNLLPLYPLGC